MTLADIPPEGGGGIFKYIDPCPGVLDAHLGAVVVGHSESKRILMERKSIMEMAIGMYSTITETDRKSL
jgi:hypothetical protein